MHMITSRCTMKCNARLSNSTPHAWRFTMTPEATRSPSYTVNSHVHQTSQRFSVLGLQVLNGTAPLPLPLTVSAVVATSLACLNPVFIPAVSGPSVRAPMTQSHLRESMKAFEWRLHCGTITSGFSCMSLIFFVLRKQPFSRSNFPSANSLSCATDAGLRRPSSIPLSYTLIAFCLL
jgi:hypothetical protein